MKIACLADEEDLAIWEYGNLRKLQDVDLIISCGDLKSEYLEYIVTLVNKPLLYVRGNHDTIYDQKPPLGCIHIDDRIFDYKGVRIVGLGGSMKYREARDMYTEKQMQKRIRKMKWKLKMSEGFDILVTHAPCAGYGDLEDLPHHGFECFNEMLDTYQPSHMMYGHIHKAYGRSEKTFHHPSGTVIHHIECFDLIEIPDSTIRRSGRLYEWATKFKDD